MSTSKESMPLIRRDRESKKAGKESIRKSKGRVNGGGNHKPEMEDKITLEAGS
jgi:hypothetical protein